jgi:hypothetical protein
MIAHPSYGLLGLAAFPYYVLFEMFGPLVELTGYIVTFIGLALNLFNHNAALLFFLAAATYGILLSVASVVLEELTLRRYPAQLLPASRSCLSVPKREEWVDQEGQEITRRWKRNTFAFALRWNWAPGSTIGRCAGWGDVPNTGCTIW